MEKSEKINIVVFQIGHRYSEKHYSGHPHYTRIEINKESGNWTIWAERRFYKRGYFFLEELSIIKSIPDGDALCEKISKLELEKVGKEDINELVFPEVGLWGIGLNYDIIRLGYDYESFEAIEKFKELIDFKGIIKELDFKVMENLDTIDDKVNFAYINNIYDLNSDLSYNEKIEYIKEQISLLESNANDLVEDSLTLSL